MIGSPEATSPLSEPARNTAITTRVPALAIPTADCSEPSPLLVAIAAGAAAELDSEQQQQVTEEREEEEDRSWVDVETDDSDHEDQEQAPFYDLAPLEEFLSATPQTPRGPAAPVGMLRAAKDRRRLKQNRIRQQSITHARFIDRTQILSPTSVSSSPSGAAVSSPESPDGSLNSSASYVDESMTRVFDSFNEDQQFYRSASESFRKTVVALVTDPEKLQHCDQNDIDGSILKPLLPIEEVPDLRMQLQQERALLQERECELLRAVELGKTLLEKTNAIARERRDLYEELTEVKAENAKLRARASEQVELKAENGALLQTCKRLRAERNEWKNNAMRLENELRLLHETTQKQRDEYSLKQNIQELLDEVEAYRAEIIFHGSGSRHASSIITARNFNYDLPSEHFDWSGTSSPLATDLGTASPADVRWSTRTSTLPLSADRDSPSTSPPLPPTQPPPNPPAFFQFSLLNENNTPTLTDTSTDDKAEEDDSNSDAPTSLNTDDWDGEDRSGLSLVEIEWKRQLRTQERLVKELRDENRELQMKVEHARNLEHIVNDLNNENNYLQQIQREQEMLIERFRVEIERLRANDDPRMLTPRLQTPTLPKESIMLELERAFSRKQDESVSRSRSNSSGSNTTSLNIRPLIPNRASPPITPTPPPSPPNFAAAQRAEAPAPDVEQLHLEQSADNNDDATAMDEEEGRTPSTGGSQSINGDDSNDPPLLGKLAQLNNEFQVNNEILQNHIANMDAERRQFEQQVNELTTQLTDLAQLNAQLGADLLNERAMTAQAHEENERLRQQIDQLKQQLAASASSSAQEESQPTRTDTGPEPQTSAAASTTISVVEAQKLREETGKVKNDNLRMKIMYTKQALDMNKLRAAVAASQDKIRSLERKLAEMSGPLSKQDQLNRLQEMRKQLSAMNTTPSSASQDNTRKASKAIADLRAKLAGIKSTKPANASATPIPTATKSPVLSDVGNQDSLVSSSPPPR